MRTRARVVSRDRSERAVALALAVGLLLAAAVAVLAVVVDAKKAEASFPGKNGKIAFVSDRETPDNPTGDDEIFITNPQGTGAKQLTFNTVSDDYPSYSANGRRIAFVRDDGNDDEIFTMGNAGGAATQLTDNTTTDTKPAFSPDGTKIAYQGSDGDSEIFTIPAGGGSRSPVTDNDSSDSEPSWSPNGQKIAYRGDDGNDSEIFTINANGSGTRFPLTNNTVDDEYPSWSPNGQRIAYENDDVEIFTVAARGGAPTNVSDSPSDDEEPSWSPDGRRIAYHSDAGGDAEIVSIAVTGGNTFPATENSAGDESADWQPNTAPPTVTSPSPRAGSTTRDRTPLISATVRDVQDELTRANMTLFVDGNQKPFNYVQGTDKLQTSSVRLSPGRHTVRVVARDFSNRVGSGSWSFTVAR